MTDTGKKKTIRAVHTCRVKNSAGEDCEIEPGKTATMFETAADDLIGLGGAKEAEPDSKTIDLTTTAKPAKARTARKAAASKPAKAAAKPVKAAAKTTQTSEGEGSGDGEGDGSADGENLV